MKQFARRPSSRARQQQQPGPGSAEAAVAPSTAADVAGSGAAADPYCFPGDDEPLAPPPQPSKRPSPQPAPAPVPAAAATASGTGATAKRHKPAAAPAEQQQAAPTGRGGQPAGRDSAAAAASRKLQASAATAAAAAPPGPGTSGPRRSGKAAAPGGTKSGGSGSGRATPATSGSATPTQPGSPAAAAAAVAPGHAAGSNLAPPQQQQRRRGSAAAPVSLPTPHRPPRLIPVGLLAAAAAAAEARHAQTVMEAQERGELVQLQDDARYAMDGLAAACSIDTQRESAVVLAEMLCSRKGRLALRSDGLAQQVLSSLAKLKGHKDGVLSLAATLVLLMLTSEDAHPAYMASVAAAVLLDQLLQSEHSFEEVSACCPAGTKLVRLLKARPLSGLLASTGVATQRELLLVALEQATSSQQASKAAAVERLKANLRQYGGLARLGRLVAEAAREPVPAARQLHQLLLVLENATFTCQDNGQALVLLQLEPRDKQEQQQAACFPGVLVQLAQQLLGCLGAAECRSALHVCLSVLMNLCHQNPEGGEAISSAGGLAAAAAAIHTLLAPVQHEQQQLCEQVLAHLELITVALGVCINLVSVDAANSRRLAALRCGGASGAQPCGAPLGDAGGQAAAAEAGADGGLVPLLCTVMSTLGQLLQHEQDAADAAEAASGEPGGDGGGEPGDSAAGEASIVEVYCGMLLGFLVRDVDGLAGPVAAALGGAPLSPLVAAVTRCLSFYVSAGAITDHTAATLQALLAHLTKAAAAAAAAGGRGDGAC